MRSEPVRHSGEASESWRVDHDKNWIAKHEPGLTWLSPEGVVIIVMWIIAFGVLFLGPFLPHVVYAVNGHSMNTTFYTNDYIFGEPNPKTISVDDIVVFQEPQDWEGTDDYVKRVVATAGDKVFIGSDGRIKVNGKYFHGEDEYKQGCSILSQTGKDHLEWTVPEGKVFVRGDNVNNSRDSRAVACGENKKPFVDTSSITLKEKFVLKFGSWKHDLLLRFGINDDPLALTK